MSRHLFLGGSLHGQIIDVADGHFLYTVPTPDPHPFRYDYDRLPPVMRDRYETYQREHQGLPDPHARTVAVYVLQGASMAREFTRWLHDTLRETSEDIVDAEVVEETPIPTVVDAPPHIQISVGGRTVRWDIQPSEAVLILQSLIQSRGPGKDAS